MLPLGLMDMSSIILVIAVSFSDRNDDSSGLAAGGPAANACDNDRPDSANENAMRRMGRTERRNGNRMKNVSSLRNGGLLSMRTRHCAQYSAHRILFSCVERWMNGEEACALNKHADSGPADGDRPVTTIPAHPRGGISDA